MERFSITARRTTRCDARVIPCHSFLLADGLIHGPHRKPRHPCATRPSRFSCAGALTLHRDGRARVCSWLITTCTAITVFHPLHNNDILIGVKHNALFCLHVGTDRCTRQAKHHCGNRVRTEPERDEMTSYCLFTLPRLPRRCHTMRALLCKNGGLRRGR